MVNAFGLDIGGANTKTAFVSTNHDTLKQTKVWVEYFPVWKNPQKLADTLSRIRNRLTSDKLDVVGVTMTAELSDAFQTKEEGVRQVLASVAKVFADTRVFVLDVEASLRSMDEALSEPLKVAAANWAATGWMVAQLVNNCVVIDVGSTSTSIIPITEGKIVANGKTDLEKLMNGELVYTGALRTNVAAIVHGIPLRGGFARVASELFAQSGDINLVLGNITPAEYKGETADGRGKSWLESLARLARIVCADLTMLDEKEILEIAEYVFVAQIEQVTAALKQVIPRMKTISNSDDVAAVVTGIGKDFLARKAATRAGFREIFDLEKLIKIPLATKATPALAVALMVANKLEGKRIRWMPY